MSKFLNQIRSLKKINKSTITNKNFLIKREDNTKFAPWIYSLRLNKNKKTINEYFDFIQKKIKPNGFFLNNNRYVKDTVGEVIRFDEYPYDDFWNIEISEKSFLQPSMHFCLTKRKRDTGNIKNELLNLYSNNYLSKIKNNALIELK